MKKSKILFLFLLLFISLSSVAGTAPRVTAQLFGEEKKYEIITYHYSTADFAANPDNNLALEIVIEAFKAIGKIPNVDQMPSKQLAFYTLFENQKAVAMIGKSEDLKNQNKKKFSAITFYYGAAGDAPVLLIISLARGKELSKSFAEGMHKIIISGKYLEIIEKHRGKMSEDYLSQLFRQNPGWK
jgi:hypothetical protein